MLCVKIQVLRSVGTWSIGQRTEKSIYDAWKDAIYAANHHVYIENQFFLSSLASNAVQNTLAEVSVAIDPLCPNDSSNLITLGVTGQTCQGRKRKQSISCGDFDTPAPRGEYFVSKFLVLVLRCIGHFLRGIF